MSQATDQMTGNIVPSLGANQQFCSGCGKIISSQALACPNCGAPANRQIFNASRKGRLAALLLCFFLGAFGIHRFYVGKVGTGILQLLTLGCLGIWTLIDFIMIIVGAFSDSEGKKVVIWTN